MKNVAIVVTYTLDEESKGFTQGIGQKVVEGDFLKFAYENIGCRTVEVVQDASGVDLWVDEEGLFVSGSPVVSYDMLYALAGNMVVTNGIDSKGNTLLFDMDEERDILRVKKIIKVLKRWTIVGIANA